MKEVKCLILRLSPSPKDNPLRHNLSSSPSSPPIASSSPSSPRAGPAEPNSGAPPDGLESGAPLPSSPVAAALRELFFDVDHRLGEFFFDIGCVWSCCCGDSRGCCGLFVRWSAGVKLVESVAIWWLGLIWLSCWSRVVAGCALLD
ncbi:hypothetical protein Drorol1_Dr00028218 [Drosera rotundifolia]